MVSVRTIGIYALVGCALIVGYRLYHDLHPDESVITYKAPPQDLKALLAQKQQKEDKPCPVCKDCPPEVACPKCPAAPPPPTPCPTPEKAKAPPPPAPAAASVSEKGMTCVTVPNTGARYCDPKPIKLGVVIPFVDKQKAYLLTNLWSWRHFEPCRDASLAKQIDLILYVSRETSEWEGIQDAVKKELEDSPAKKCFGEIVFKSSDCPKDKDVYGAGTLHQFYGIFDAKYLKMKDYDYIMYQEPDMRPIKKYWLDKMWSECAKDHPFWEKGTAPRYGRGEMLHMNGNALYRYNDPNFIKYICQSRGAFKPYASFDQSLTEHRNVKKLYNDQHKFIYTDFMQNRATQTFDFDKFNKDHPNTFIVHGKGITKMLDEKHHSPYANHKTKSGADVHHGVQDQLTAQGANACRKIKSVHRR